MQALERIIAEAERGEMVFPTHADVAFRVRLALDDPEIHLAKAAQIVQAEPLLAARVVALANSVAFNRSGQQVTDVRAAINRLGLKFVRALTTAVLMRQMAAGGQSQAHRTLAVRLWEHTVHVAALAHVLAARFKIASPDMALFAGIVHEVGGFYLISRSNAEPELFKDGSVLAPAAEARLGRAVLRALSVPEEVVAALEFIWLAEHSTFPPEVLGDVLRLSNQLTPIESPLQVPRDVTQLAIEGQAAEILASILEDSGEEMTALTAALRY